MEYKNIFIDGIMHMGDMVMTASVLPVLRKNCPEATITYLCSADLAFVANLLDGVDQVIPYRYKSKGGYMDVYRMGRQLAKYNFDLGISLDPRERVTLMKWFAQIPERISMEQALGWKLGWEKLFYTRDLSLPQGWKYQEHSMASSFQQMMRDYFGDPETGFIPPKLKVTEEDKEWAQDLLKKVPAGSKKIAICFQTTTQTKDWPVEKFSALGNWLQTQYGATLLLTGIPAHTQRAEAIMAGLQNHQQVINLVGMTTFQQLVALLSQVDLLISLDTGTAHIGAAAGCSVVTIFTHNSPVIYRAPGYHCETVSAHLPCSGKHICIGPMRCKKTDCVDGVTLAMVQEKVKKFLG
ncbi:glycosyltransferase family 9 protein [Acidaminococcus sp.]|uniref:glycosyltransferase family 9 protein n=1 Tax=Acidaminococcus sp. TaxID=1872103 RepID=UPI003D7DC28B